MPIRPTGPKFGGVKEIESGRWAVWTGGEPKGDWSELKELNPEVIIPTQYRATTISGQSKSRHYRVTGLTNKFSRSSNLLTFQKKVLKHLKDHGLDTITYLQHPNRAGEVVCVINQHALFTMQEGVKLGNDRKKDGTSYDTYCMENDQDAKEFLINSMDEDLERQLYENCNEQDSFIAMWFNLINIVKSVSIMR